MKNVLILAAIVFIQMISVEGEHPFKECTKELGITKEMIKEVHEKKTLKPEMKCLSACMMKKTGILEAGNKFNRDTYKKLVTKHDAAKAEEYTKATQECVDAAKSVTDECEFARNIDACFIKKYPDLLKVSKSKQEASKNKTA